MTNELTENRSIRSLNGILRRFSGENMAKKAIHRHYIQPMNKRER